MDTKPTRRLNADPNVAPTIDAVLVLLVIFMITVPMVIRGFRAKPPIAQCTLEYVERVEDVTSGIDTFGKAP